MNSYLSLMFDLASKRPRIAKARMAAGIFTKRGTLISVGFNSLKTHPKAQEWHRRANEENPNAYPGSCLHAEMDAILRCDIIPEKAFLVVARAKQPPLSGCVPKPHPNAPNLIPGLALPCPACALAIRESHISKALFTMDEPLTSYGELKL